MMEYGTALTTSLRIQARHDALAAQLSSSPPLGILVLGPELTRLQTELSAARTAVRIAQAKIDAMMEEGRRAGALPGWFR